MYLSDNQKAFRGRFLSLGFVCLMASQMLSCSGGVSSTGGGGESSTGGMATLDKLPRATSPVMASSSSSLSPKHALSAVKKAANTGIHLSSLQSSSFDSRSSLAACEMSNRFREAIRHAAEGDKIQCYIQEIVKANPSMGIDPYDGSYHRIGLRFLDSEGNEITSDAPGYVKMQLVRDPDTSRINRFELFACQRIEENQNVQSQYLLQTIEGSVFGMISKEVSIPSGSEEHSGGQTVEVSGTLNGEGQFIGTKHIAMSYRFENPGGGSGEGSAEAQQTLDSIVYNGFEAGVFLNDFGTSTYSDRIYSVAQLISPTDPASINYSIGDGAAHTILAGNFTDGSWSDDRLQGWNGDTTMADSESSYLSLLEGQDPVPVITIQNPEFSDSEFYACNEEPEITLDVYMENIQTACSELDMEDHGYVNCWEIIEGDL